MTMAPFDGAATAHLDAAHVGDIHGAFDAVQTVMQRHSDVRVWVCVGDVASNDGEYFEPVAPLNSERRRAYAFDLGAHFREAGRNVADFRLACGVLDDGFAFRQSRCQQNVVRGADRDFREHDACAAQSFRRSRDDVARVDVDLGAERLQSHQM